MHTPAPIDEEYRPLNKRRRLLIALLAVSTAVIGVLALLERPGGPQYKRALPAACAPGQTEHCVGGKAEVIVAPVASGASR